MKTKDLTNLAQFAAIFPTAWNVFASAFGDVELTSFEYRQESGSYVATDSNSGEYRFRVYRSAVIALVTPSATYVLVEDSFVLA